MKNQGLGKNIKDPYTGIAPTHSLHQDFTELHQTKFDQDPLLELAELKWVRQQSQDAQQKIEMLLNANALLRQKLIRLAKKCAHAQHFMYHDELTGLPNRNLLLDRLKQAINHSIREQKPVALLFIDLDDFKNINDTFGHATGDKLLQQVAARLTTIIRQGDTVCRYGGDEFIIMLPETDGQESLAAVTEKIRLQLAEPYDLDGKSMVTTASIGSALYRTDGQSIGDLIKQADTAMYKDKMHKVHRS